MSKKSNQQAAEKRKREEAFNAYLDASQELEPDAYVVEPRIWIGTGDAGNRMSEKCFCRCHFPSDNDRGWCMSCGLMILYGWNE